MLLVTHELPDSGLFATQYSPLPVRVSPLLLGYRDVTTGDLLARLDNDQYLRLEFSTCRNSQQDDNDREEGRPATKDSGTTEKHNARSCKQCFAMKSARVTRSALKIVCVRRG